jgi:hypothetical protein
LICSSKGKQLPPHEPHLIFTYFHFAHPYLSRRTTSPRESRITKAPGAILLSFVDFFFSPKVVEQTFKPLVADWRFEYFEALHQGRTLKARWISARYRYSFIMAMSLSKIFSLLKQIKSVTK